MVNFTEEQVVALVNAARRNDDGTSDGGGGATGAGESPTPSLDEVPEPVLRAARALSEDSGCTVRCSSGPDGGILCVISDCPPPDADPEESDLERILLERMVDEAGKAGRGIRIQRDGGPAKPNDPVERLDRRLALQEAAAEAFSDLLTEATPEDLTDRSRDTCLSIAVRLITVPGRAKLEAAFRRLAGGVVSQPSSPQDAARELLTLSKYLKSWIGDLADGLLKGAALPDVDREFWTVIRDTVRAGR